MTPSARPCRCVPLSQQTQKRVPRVGTSPQSPVHFSSLAHGTTLPRPDWFGAFYWARRALNSCADFVASHLLTAVTD